MKNRFSTMLMLAMSTALALIGLALSGPLGTVFPMLCFFVWLRVWQLEVRWSRREEEEE